LLTVPTLTLVTHMLSDPIAVPIQQTLTPSGGVAQNMRRTAIGKYTCVDVLSTSATPSRLSILPNVVSTGPSTFKARYESEKAVSPVNVVQQKNDLLRIDINISGNLRSFNATDIIHAGYYLAIVLFSNFTRIISGES